MEANQKKIINIYSAFVASLLMQVIPSVAIQTFGLLLLICVFFGCYFYRSKEDKGSLIENHTTFIIRTFWIWSLFLLIAMGAAVFWILGTGGHEILIQSIDTILGGGSIPSEAELMRIANRFFLNNLIALVVCFGPCIIYIAYRICKGLSRALKGYRVDNEKSWF
jgi:uncharacterized membrane protein